MALDWPRQMGCWSSLSPVQNATLQPPPMERLALRIVQGGSTSAEQYYLQQTNHQSHLRSTHMSCVRHDAKGGGSG
jgi:hypothetical protein